MKMVGNIMNLFGKKDKGSPTRGYPMKGSPRVLDSHGLIDETLTADVPTDPRKGGLNIVESKADDEEKHV